MKSTVEGKLSSRLEVNNEQLYKLLGESTDLVRKQLKLGEHTELAIFILMV